MRRSVPLVAAMLASVPASSVVAQEAAQPVGETPPPGRQDRAEDIVVTGSLIRRLPREYIASPVQTYGLEDVEQAGSGSLSEYMLTIPQNFTGDLSDFGTSASSIGTTLGAGTTFNQYDGFAAFALRGLASDATLTLVNGRRMASIGMIEAPTVSVIPSALIDRIDIIADGASATYGADAVAGVVNIVTRKITQGAELRLRASTATQTGANNAELSALAGHSWNGGHVYGAAMYQKRSAYIEDPILVSNTLLQISQLPNEEVSGLYAGAEQELGDVKFSVDASHFHRKRDASINYIGHAEDNRFYDNEAAGYSVYGNVHWQASAATSFDLNLDWGRNRTTSALFRGERPFGTPRVSYTHRNTLFAAELTGQTTLARLPAGPILLAGGAQYRRETFRTTAKIFFNRNGGEREVKSLFGEVNVPIVAADMGVPLVRSLALSAAARYEDLGFDDALAPKVGLRWQIDRSIALRGTYARSFLVPRFRDTIGIAEQVSFWNYPYAFLDPAEQNPALPAGNALVMFRAGANPDLKTQNADTFTAGIDLTPAFIPNLSIKAGYYRIKITGRVVTPSQGDSVSVPDLQGFNTVNPSQVLVNSIVNNPATFRWFVTGVPFVNGGGTVVYNSASQIPAALLSQVQLVADIRPQNFAVESTDGIDFDLAYRTRLFGGDARLTLTGQYILGLDLTAGSGRATSRLDGYAQPADLRFNGSVVWGRDGYSIGSVVNYVDGFTDSRPGEPRRKIGSFTTTSLFLGLKLERLVAAPGARGGELQLVVANVFNQRPNFLPDAVLGYDPYNNPPNPRTISLVFTKRFGAR